MFNRYISSDGFEPMRNMPPTDVGDSAEDTVFEEVRDTSKENEQTAANKGGPLKGLFGGNLKLDSDTILLLVLVYFLVSDNKNQEDGKTGRKDIYDTIIIAAVLLLLGM